MGVLYNSRIVTDGLVLCVDAGDKMSYPGAGTAWTDLSKNKNNGTLTNMDSSNFSNDGAGSLTFDGSDEYVDISQEIQFDRTDPFTLCVWLNNQDTGYANIINNENTSYRGYQFSFFDQKLQIYLRSTTSNYIAVQCSNNFTFNAWKHCIGTYDGSSDVSGMKLYIDGVLQSITTISNTLTTSTDSNETTLIGTRRPSSVTYFDGYLSNIQIYNRELSANEVQQNYKATKGRFGL